MRSVPAPQRCPDLSGGGDRLLDVRDGMAGEILPDFARQLGAERLVLVLAQLAERARRRDHHQLVDQSAQHLTPVRPQCCQSVGTTGLIAHPKH